ncbi:galactose mutarotase [Stakelama sp. CBK3Z-3]|uniref:Aldose 1-epimerase n=1 Tax=Stakelama flava TaxID=2860338 RepID=A0ABS6XIA7_9SPHN|nr:aldose epimerase family protein [Stakelama flava]MBW4329934.1 galactose mutarotase [Stakelama flava]
MRTKSKSAFAMGVGLTAMLLPGAALAGTAERAAFGTMPDGHAVEKITLANDHGMRLSIITLGASVQALDLPDRDGKSADVVLGYDTLEGYIKKGNFFGAIVGRVANRIADGRFTLDGKQYQVPINNGDNALHGGPEGFDKKVWTVVSVKGGAKPSVTLRYVSPDGEMGFPGKLTTTATYSIDEGNHMRLDLSATSDAPTVVNLSNHTYWNLAGEGAPQGALDEKLTIPARWYTPTDAGSIPTGEFRDVSGSIFDFRKPMRVALHVRDGSDPQIVLARGYDHNWVVSRKPPAAMQLMARLEDPDTGRAMEIRSNQPGVQFYSGNFFDSTLVGKKGHLYRQGDAIVLEPQAFPDTPNRPEFGSVRLAPGQTYENHILYTFTTDGK